MNLTSKIFVAISSDKIIFGKNSDRPSTEVQELVYEPSSDDGQVVKCTYKSVPPTATRNAVILSKSAWTWGCEMGSNEHDIVGGFVPVKTCVQPESGEGLIAADLLRLALERSKSSEEAVDIIGSLLSEFGQDGANVEDDKESLYSGTFLLADKKEVWRMETAGRGWVAKKLSPGAYIICGFLSIDNSFDKSCSNLEDLARGTGRWNGEGKVSWSEVFSDSHADEEVYKLDEDAILAKSFSNIEDFKLRDMVKVLRDKDTKICRAISNGVATVASQVSVLTSNAPSCHWFTATPDPTYSVFKPFIFTPNVRVSKYTKSSSDGDRHHHLYTLHAKAIAEGDSKVMELLKDMETNCMNELETFISDFKEGQPLSEVDDLLKDIVETEVKFYH